MKNYTKRHALRFRGGGHIILLRAESFRSELIGKVKER